DVEVRDRREVEEVDEGQAADPEDRQVAELPARGAERARREDRDAGEEEDRGAGSPHLGKPERGQAARVDDDLRHRRVDRPQHDRSEDERVPERGTAVCRGLVRELRDVERSVDHGGGGYPGGRRSTLWRRGTWRSLVARLLWEQEAAGSYPAVPTEGLVSPASGRPPGCATGSSATSASRSRRSLSARGSPTGAPSRTSARPPASIAPSSSASTSSTRRTSTGAARPRR